MTTQTNLKQIGCLILLVIVLLVVVRGCAEHHERMQYKRMSIGTLIEVDGVVCSVSLNAPVDRQGQFDYSILLVTLSGEGISVGSSSLNERIMWLVLDDDKDDKMLAEKDTLYLVQEGKIVLEKTYRELGIDASRLSTDWIDMLNYLRPILEPLIREHVQPQEPEMEKE